ncbi:MAG TPA: GAF domain-containing protein [Tepidiformaceae bacterium]|jgi:signal transduction histidine kinase|nr:GAF domain-containing protein [Tepidiformaceae bacterium]
MGIKEASSGGEPEVLRQLGDMAVTSEILVGSEDLAEILQRLAQRARDITSADYAAISTFDEHGVLTRFVYTGISEEQARRLGEPPRGRGLLGELWHHERPMRLADVIKHPKYSGWPEGHPEMGAFLGVPIRAGGRAIGSLYMTRDRGRADFTTADEVAAAVLALQAGVSLSYAMARERTGRLFLLEERVRIAHDLHDGTIQSLYALGLEFDGLAARQEFPDEVRRSLRRGVERINELIADIRTYITMLEAATPIEQPNLTQDLAFVIRQIVPPGIASVVNISAAALQELTARESEDLLYIAREALSNSVRHGAPTKIAVDLRQTASATVLTVQDNGVGFDEASTRRGLGTVTMRTRCERLGAELTIIPIPGMGTTVRIAVPRRYEEEEEDDD